MEPVWSKTKRMAFSKSSDIVVFRSIGGDREKMFGGGVKGTRAVICMY
jgi:hypothetical protein